MSTSLASPPTLVLIAVVAALATWIAIPPLMPVLRRYALARPNARSSHSVPTPQGGGLAVVGVSVLLLTGLALASHTLPEPEVRSLLVLAAGAVVLAGLGAYDDIRPLPALPRLVVQALAVAAVILAVPSEVRLWPEWMPFGVERALVTLGGLWFVNLINFMDGLDWMTVAELVPPCAAMAVLAALGGAPVAAGLAAAALGGALVGFAPFNRPVARLFLGDVGSLPIGLIAGYALYRTAGQGSVLVALIFALYPLADATITLIRRALKGERLHEAHRSHFYQRATVNGLSVIGVVGRVALLGLVLALTGLLLAVTWTPGRAALAAVVAVASVAALLADFSLRRGPA